MSEPEQQPHGWTLLDCLAEAHMRRRGKLTIAKCKTCGIDKPINDEGVCPTCCYKELRKQ